MTVLPIFLWPDVPLNFETLKIIFPYSAGLAVVGLLVIGPERLPGAIRTGSVWLNRLKRGFNDIKQEVQQGLETGMRRMAEGIAAVRRGLISTQGTWGATAGLSWSKWMRSDWSPKPRGFSSIRSIPAKPCRVFST